MKRILLILVLLGLAAGAVAQTNTPTNTPTATPTNTPTNTPTSTPTLTPTRTPTRIAENPYAFWSGGRANGVVEYVTAATRIYPLVGVTHVRDRTTIQYIIPPWDAFAGSLTLIADDGFLTTTGGNVSLATYLQPGQSVTFVYDGTTWHPGFIVGTPVPSHTSTPTFTPTATPTPTPTP
jgi:hypothetical protein